MPTQAELIAERERRRAAAAAASGTAPVAATPASVSMDALIAERERRRAAQTQAPAPAQSNGAGLGPVNPMVAEGRRAQAEYANQTNPIIAAQHASQRQAMDRFAAEKADDLARKERSLMNAASPIPFKDTGPGGPLELNQERPDLLAARATGAFVNSNIGVANLGGQVGLSAANAYGAAFDPAMQGALAGGEYGDITQRVADAAQQGGYVKNQQAVGDILPSIPMTPASTPGEIGADITGNLAAVFTGWGVPLLRGGKALSESLATVPGLSRTLRGVGVETGENAALAYGLGAGAAPAGSDRNLAGAQSAADPLNYVSIEALRALGRAPGQIDKALKIPDTPTNAGGVAARAGVGQPQMPPVAPAAAATQPAQQAPTQPQAAAPPPVAQTPPNATAVTPAPPQAVPTPPAGTLTPVGNGIAVDSYNALPVKTKEGILRALEASGMTIPQAKDAIRSLNDLPPDRANMFEFELIRRYGGPDQFPNLQSNLTAMGSDFSMQTGKKGGSPQEVMNKSLLDQAQSEGDYLTRTAEQLFGEGKVATKAELEAFRTQLGGRYRSQLAQTYPGITKLRNQASKNDLGQRVDAARKNLTDYLLRPDVIEQVPPWVQDQVMMQISDDLRWLQKDDAGLQFASRANPELTPLLTSDQTLRYSPQLWRTLVQMYPTQVGHSLQSAYRAAIDDAFSGVSNAIDRTTAKRLMRLRGQSRVRANAADPNKRGVGLLHLIEEASPGYKELRQKYGDVVGAQKAADMPDNFFRVAKDEEALADFVDVYENELTPLQQDAVRNGITTQIRQALKNKTEFTQPWELDAIERGQLPNLTAISSQPFLEALPRVFGETGERMADAIRLSRANIDNIQAINKNFASGTPKGMEIRENARNLYESRAASNLNPIDNATSTLAGVGTLSAFAPGGQVISAAALGGAAMRAMYRAYKSGKSLTPGQKEALAEWLFKPRRETDAPPPTTPRRFSKAGYAGNVATGAVIGGTAGALGSGGDPTATGQGIVAGAIGGGARAGLRAVRAERSIIKPPPATRRSNPPPAGAISPPVAPRPLPGQQSNSPAMLGGAGLGAIGGAAANPDDPAKGAFYGALGGAGIVGGAQLANRLAKAGKTAPAGGGVPVKIPPFDGPAKLRELLGEPSKYLPWHNNPQYKELAAKAGQSVGEAPVANIVPGQSQIRHNFKEVKQRYGNTDADLPILVRENGKYYINDGTHRIAAQVDDGAKTIRARIIDLDAVSPAGKTAPKAPAGRGGVPKPPPAAASENLDLTPSGRPRSAAIGDARVKYFVENGVLTLQEINVPSFSSGKGQGSRAIDAIIAQADAEGLPIRLIPHAYGHRRLSDGDLKNLYLSRGFKEQTGDWMRREPGASPASASKPPPVKSGFGSSSKLPMDEASRMSRAREMGFDVDTPLYHGTTADFDQFEIGDLGFHVGTSEQANKRVRALERDRGTQGANVMPVYVRAKKPLDLPDVGEWNDSRVVAEKLAQTPWGRKHEAELLEIADNATDDVRMFEDADAWRADGNNQELLDEIRRLIEADGYDSVRYHNQVENAYGDRPGLTRSAQKRRDALIAEKAELNRSRPIKPPPKLGATQEDIDEWIFAKDPETPPELQKKIDDINAELDALDGQTEAPYSYIIFDPSNIRGKFAKFDPSEASSSKLLAGVRENATGLGTAGGALAGGTFARDTDGDGVVSASERAAQALGGAVTGGVLGAGARAGISAATRRGKVPASGNALRGKGAPAIDQAGIPKGPPSGNGEPPNVVSLQDAQREKFANKIRDVMASTPQRVADQKRAYHSSGRLPLPVGTRMRAPKFSNGDLVGKLDGWVIEDYFISPMKPDEYGYVLKRGDETLKLYASSKGNPYTRATRPQGWDALVGPDGAKKYQEALYRPAKEPQPKAANDTHDAAAAQAEWDMLFRNAGEPTTSVPVTRKPPAAQGFGGRPKPSNALKGKPRPVEARRAAPRGNKPFSDPRLSPGENKTAEMVLNGYSYDEIADEMMTSRDVVKKQASVAQQKLGRDVQLPRPGMGKRPPGSTKREAAFELFDSGADNAQIAERLGVSIGNVRTYRSYWKQRQSAPVASVEGAMYNPPAMPDRPFEADYPQKDWPDGPPVDAQGRLTRDKDGRPLDQTSVIVGRNKAPGYGPKSEADRSLRDRIAVIQTLKKAGSSLERVPRSSDQTSGGWRPDFDANGRFTGRGSAQITDDLDRPIAGLDDQEVIVLSHELAHSIDFKGGSAALRARNVDDFNDRKWGIEHKNPHLRPESRAKLESQLERIYRDLNNPVDSEVKIRTPKDHGYEAIEADRELWAEAIRAYMYDPNYIKTVAPDVAFMIRDHVNRNSSLRKTIQFNAIPTVVGAGGLGLGAVALNGQPAEAQER